MFYWLVRTFKQFQILKLSPFSLWCKVRSEELFSGGLLESERSSISTAPAKILKFRYLHENGSGLLSC